MSSPEPPAPSRRSGARSAAPVQGDVKRALQAIGLVALVVVFNIVVYCVIAIYLAKSVGGQPTFLAFIMFLSVALSFAVILRIALGEAVSANIKNPFIRRIGVTPIMTIVAALGALLATFTPLGDKIFASVRPEFMLAKIGITCVTKDETKAPEAIRLVTLISSDDEQYIAKVKEYLDKEVAKKENRDAFSLTWVQHSRSDKFYNVLQQYARSGAKGAEMLTSQIRNDNKWLAYVAPLNDPQSTTFVLVPTIFDKDHHTSFFAVLTDAADTTGGRFVPGISTRAVSTERALPLFEVEITPRMHSDLRQTIGFNVEVYTDHICWHVAPGSGI